MPDIGDQLRDYFDASVERVMVEDIPATRRVLLAAKPVERRWFLHPALAALWGFVATVTTLGGTLILAVQKPALRFDTEQITETLTAGKLTTPNSWLVITILAVVIASAVALTVRTQQPSPRKENDMTSTLDYPQIETLDTKAGNRRFITAIGVLVVAVLALGAWVVYDQISEQETAAPAEVRDFLDEYHAAWNNYDGAAFLALTTEDYVFDSGGAVFDRDAMATTISGSGRAQNFTSEIIGDPVISGDGPTYYVAVVNRLDSSLYTTDIERGGISTFVLVDGEDGLRMGAHHFVGTS